MFRFSITTGELFQNLFIALFCGMLISVIYRLSYRGPGYSVAFINSLVVLSMITAIVIMVIGNNLARAFGLVGAMSIIRFRTALKDTQDIIFVFFALAIGMASGVGFHSMAIIGSLFVGATLFILGKVNKVSTQKQDFLLQFTYETNNNNHHDAEYSPLLEKYCRRNKIINAKTVGNDGELELSFYVDLKDRKRNTEFIRELKKIGGVRHVNLFFDEEEF
ncbi:MAG: DUF4956 domain-containing protein [bacterium]